MIPKFSSYSTVYDHAVMTRTDDGILEVRLHTDGGPLVWGDGPHTELPYVFADIGADLENRVVILTGTGDRFIADIDDSWVGAMNPAKWRKLHSHGTRLNQRLLEIEAPVIAAVNGRATVHAEMAVLSDIVLCSEDTVFRDGPHFRHGTVPGDGVHIIWPLLLGPNRGRHFLLTAAKLGAEEALRLGVVAEVLPAEDLLDRARAIAADLAAKPDTVLKYTREAVTMPLRRAFFDGIGYGMALEGLGAFESWPTGEPG